MPSDPRLDDPTRRQIGTERCVPFDNPYAVFGDIEAREAIAQYQQHDYAVAAQLFGELAGRMHTPELVSLQQRYAAFAALAAVYAAWDVLDFPMALAHMETLLALPIQLIAEFAPHIALLACQRTMLRELDAVSRSVIGRGHDAVQTLASPAAMLPLLGTLHANALRRADQGRYDFAALFGYRCLELISQHRLATYGLVTNAPQFDVLGSRKAVVSERFQQQQRAAGRTALRGLGKLRSIGLFDGYMLLAALEDPLVDTYAIKQIEERSQARNTSVLAHGYRLINRAEYEQFAAVVDEVITLLFSQVLHQPRDDWEATVRFLHPFARYTS